jgi:alpha-L-arabinofuranosidase
LFSCGPDRLGIAGFGNAARVFEINAKDRTAANSLGRSENVNIREKTAPVSGASISYTFPAHSVTVIEVMGSR